MCSSPVLDRWFELDDWLTGHLHVLHGHLHVLHHGQRSKRRRGGEPRRLDDALELGLLALAEAYDDERMHRRRLA